MAFPIAYTNWGGIALPNEGERSFDFSSPLLRIGISGSPVKIKTSGGVPIIRTYTTSASVNTGTSVRYAHFSHVATGAGSVGHRAEFLTSCAVALGAWSNALKGVWEWGAGTSQSTGLSSAICAELKMPGRSFTDGHYAPLEVELVTPASSSGYANHPTSLMYLNASGDATALAKFNTSGFLFELGTGITNTDNGLFDAENNDAPVFTHVLKCLINDVVYYLGLNTSKALTD